MAVKPLGTVQVAYLAADGQVVTDSQPSIQLSLLAPSGAATLSGATSSTTTAGVATFTNLVIDKPGTGYRLVAKAPGVDSAVSQPIEIAVNPDLATHIAFLSQPATSAVSGQPLGTVKVAFLTADNRSVPGATSSIQLTLATLDALSQLAGTSFMSPSSGVATFDGLSIARAGRQYRLVAHATGFADAVSDTITIVPGPAVALRFSRIESSGAGATFGPAVSAIDAAGNVVPGATPTVTISVATADNGGAPIFGATTATAVGGTATFSDLNIHKMGNYTLAASAPGLTSAVSNQFYIAATTLTQLVFAVQPSGGRAGATLPSFTVVGTDIYGNTFMEPRPLSFGTVTLTFGNNPSSATLTGTTGVLGHGTAVFATTSIDKAGTGYTIVASAPGFTSVTSAPFDVQP